MPPPVELLRLAYLGNLGLAHDVPLLCEFLVKCAASVRVEVCFIGTAEKSLGAVRRDAAVPNLTISSCPSIDFEKLAEKLPAMKFDYGLVSLSERFLGLVSPSKFSGYLAGALPMIYLGPAGSNAAMVCDEFGAGMRLTGEDLRGEKFAATLDQLMAAGTKERMRAATVPALRHFDRYNGGFLAEAILERAGSLQP